MTSPSHQDVCLTSTLTCPQCGTVHPDVPMPTDACQFFWDCPACQTVLKPQPGDCCVFCSYGTTQCPPLQGAGVCN